jgi:hypothetical protein
VQAVLPVDLRGQENQSSRKRKTVEGLAQLVRDFARMWPDWPDVQIRGFSEVSGRRGNQKCKLFRQLSRQECNFEIGDSSDAGFCAVCNHLHTAAISAYEIRVISRRNTLCPK